MSYPDENYPLGVIPLVDEDGEAQLLDVMVAPCYPKYPDGLSPEAYARLRSESRQFIQARYDEGVLFYSKDIFRMVAEQFEPCLQGSKSEQEVCLVGLDGRPAQFLVQVGKDTDEGREPSWPGYKVLQ
jgi:hypothetical protein